MFSYKESCKNVNAINAITTHVATEGYCRITSILDFTEVQQYLDSINQIDAIESNREKEGARDQDYDYNYYSFSGTHYYNSPRRYRVLILFSAPIGNDVEIPTDLPIVQLEYKAGDVLAVHGFLVHHFGQVGQQKEVY